MSGHAPEIWIGEDADAIAREGARRIGELARRCIAARGRFVLALAGGTTPRRLYKCLAQTDGIDWQRIDIFFSDERLVPAESADSNYLMAKETLLSQVSIPAANVHQVATQLPGEEAASAYEQTLRGVLASIDPEDPRIDVALLGMGPDGHTASIFPGSRLLAGIDNDFLLDDPETGPLKARRPEPSLAAYTTERLVAAIIDSPKPPAARVTMTPYLLNRSRHVLVLVAGEDKVAAVSAALESDARVSEIPIRAIAPHSGELVWLLDRRAARALGNPPL